MRRLSGRVQRGVRRALIVHGGEATRQLWQAIGGPVQRPLRATTGCVGSPAGPSRGDSVIARAAARVVPLRSLNNRLRRALLQNVGQSQCATAIATSGSARPARNGLAPTGLDQGVDPWIVLRLLMTCRNRWGASPGSGPVGLQPLVELLQFFVSELLKRVRTLFDLLRQERGHDPEIADRVLKPGPLDRLSPSRFEIGAEGGQRGFG
jgi:hypothetical protein